MPATETVFLKHTFLNKQSQARPYTARAHSRYIARLSATQYHYVENMPLNYRDRQRWYHDMEKDLRKNGRVIDKFTVSIPKDVALEHAAEVVTRLGRELGEGRAPFEFSLQGWGTSNHHSHVIYCDRDPDTGRRIFGTTDRNSTREIKLEWERVANGLLEELGYDVRVKVKEGWEEKLEVADHIVETNEMVSENVLTDAPVSTDAEIDELPESVEVDDDVDGEIDMANLTPAERVQQARDLWENYRYIQRGITERDEVARKYEVFRQRAENAAIEAAEGITVVSLKDQSRYQAQLAYDATHKANGQAKGIRIGFFGRTLWESQARKAAIESEARLQGSQRLYEMAKKDLELLTHNSARLSKEAEDLKIRAESLERHVRVLGSDEELAAASRDQLTKINAYIGDMTLEELVVMVEEGEISPDECADMLRVMGRQNDLEEFLEAEQRREQAEDGGHSL